MKIEPTRIVIDHLKSLKNAETGKVSAVDYVIFFVVPVLAGALGWKFICPDNNAYDATLTFFGIFIGLLINIQVALFAILQRKWREGTDERSRPIKDEKLTTRLRLLKQANSNISYLTLISCLGAALALASYAGFSGSGAPAALISFVVAHFFLTLLMIIKRLHALFAEEYDRA